MMSLRMFYALVILWIINTNGCHGAIAEPPENTVVEPGETLTLTCESTTGAGDTIAFIKSGVQAVSACVGYNGFNCSCSGNKATLFRNDADSAVQETYTCQDAEPGAKPARGSVLVLDEPMSCGPADPLQVIRGQDVTFTCKVSYTSPAGAATVTDEVYWDSTDKGSTTKTTVIQVPTTGTSLPEQTCTADFTFTHSPSTLFDDSTSTATRTCTTPAYTISYCPDPSSIAITPPASPVEGGSTFTCSADGYPTPTYTWYESVSGTSGTGGNFTIPPSAGPYNLTCTAEISSIPGCAGITAVSAGTAIPAITSANPADLSATTPNSNNVGSSITSGNGGSTVSSDGSGGTGQATVNPNDKNGTDTGTGDGNWCERNPVECTAIIVSAIFAFLLPLLLLALCLPWGAICARCCGTDKDDDERNRDEYYPSQGYMPAYTAFRQFVFARPSQAKFKSNIDVYGTGHQGQVYPGAVAQYGANNGVMYTPGMYSNFHSSHQSLYH